MAGAGTGQPVAFVCPVARRNRDTRTWSLPPGHDRIRLTGRTKPNPGSSVGQRMLTTSSEYRCECGHVGWSAHVDLPRRAARS